jgi:HD-GYP domain-containing protein (c-di-GMP phosphodiesterase class II)
MSGLLGQTVALSSRLLESNLSLLRSLGNAIAKRDADTDAHNYRVTCYAVSLAEALGVGKETIAELVLGAFLHDVGKIGIPDQILLKPGRLTSEEFQVMKTHAMLGIEIVAGNPWLAGAEDHPASSRTLRRERVSGWAHWRGNTVGRTDFCPGRRVRRIDLCSPV